MICTKTFTLESDGHLEVINITDRVKEFVSSSGIVSGIALVYYLHTTGAVVVTEHEAGIIVDLENVLEKLVSENDRYEHHLRNVDFNGNSHIRSIILGSSLTLPVINRELHLGRYQEILVLDMQVGREPRQFLVQLMGE